MSSSKPPWWRTRKKCYLDRGEDRRRHVKQILVFQSNACVLEDWRWNLGRSQNWKKKGCASARVCVCVCVCVWTNHLACLGLWCSRTMRNVYAPTIKLNKRFHTTGTQTDQVCGKTEPSESVFCLTGALSRCFLTHTSVAAGPPWRLTLQRQQEHQSCWRDRSWHPEISLFVVTNRILTLRIVYVPILSTNNRPWISFTCMESVWSTAQMLKPPSAGWVNMMP